MTVEIDISIINKNKSMSSPDFNPFLAETENDDGSSNPFVEENGDESFIEVMDNSKSDGVPPTIQVRGEQRVLQFSLTHYSVDIRSLVHLYNVIVYHTSTPTQVIESCGRLDLLLSYLNCMFTFVSYKVSA